MALPRRLRRCRSVLGAADRKAETRTPIGRKDPGEASTTAAYPRDRSLYHGLVGGGWAWKAAGRRRLPSVISSSGVGAIDDFGRPIRPRSPPRASLSRFVWRSRSPDPLGGFAVRQFHRRGEIWVWEAHWATWTHRAEFARSAQLARTRGRQSATRPPTWRLHSTTFTFGAHR